MDHVTLSARWRYATGLTIGMLVLAALPASAATPEVSAPAPVAARPAQEPGGARARLPFRHPLAPGTPIVTGYSAPDVRWHAGHLGVDFAAAQGRAVRAPGPGIVSFAGTVVDRGIVVIDHGTLGGRRLRTTLEPVSPGVRAGQVVTRGQQVGTVAGRHRSCAPSSCLHWGVRLGDEYRNPLAFLGERRLAVLLE